ncbi:MAG: InlB B-repeat-containing protein, partial [Lachnospiraceae bacterium]|nr:InlB B-repeat-containing protein [Lachnospiraceae bacterium]
MKKRRRQRFLSLMLVLCMIVSAGMMTPLSTSANATDGYVTQETQQEDSALTGGAAADQTGDAATDIATDTQEQTTTAGDIQTAEPSAVSEEAAASAAEQTDAGTKQSNPAATESSAVIETPTDPVTVEAQTDGAQSTENTDASAPNEEQKQDPEETDESWPAQTFEGHANNITVNVTAAEGIFPAGTTMVTTAVSAQTAKDIANQASDGQTEVVDAIGVDISFRDASGNEIEPKDGQSVEVSMTVDAASTLSGDNFSVVHQSDDGNVQTVTENATAEGAVFEADAFSIYVITSEGPAIETWIFHDAAGNVIAGFSQKVKNGETVYAPTTPEKKGYKFLGWSYTKNAAALQDGDPGDFSTLTASVSETGNVDLYPVFQQAYYVFFLDDQGRVSTTKEGVSGVPIDVADVTIPLDSTHSVTGWYTDAERTKKVESVTLTDHNVTLYPKVEEGHYLYFSSGDGASYVKPVFVTADGKTAEPEEPTRPGYTFSHWSEKEGGSEYSFGSTISKDTTLYAVWEANDNTEYTVIFWKQSVNDKKNAKDSDKTYDYAESVTRTGKTGSYASPQYADKNKSYTGFSYNSSKSGSVTINGDGTTILNVYYDRNLLTINFYTWQSYGWSGGKWISYDTFTGLYGQTLAQNGYSWPEESTWKNYDQSQRLTFLDAFIFDTLDEYGNQSLIELYAYESNGYYSINHYKQNLDGSYSYSSPANKTDSSGGTFYFSNKYTGFTVNSYTRANNTPTADWNDWVSVEPNDSARISKNLYVRYTRNSYKLAYYNYNSVASERKLLYEASLGDCAAYKPSRPSGLPEAYTFQGWFKDKKCTVPFDFDSTMPANDVMIYAKWAPPEYTGTVHTNMEGTEERKQLTIQYGDKINENDMPTVKDVKGSILKEGDGNYTVIVPEGYSWAGWATKSGNDYTIYNFNTGVYSDITLYPYYINGAKYKISYQLGDGGTGTVPSDDKQYAENSYADIMSASGITAPEGKTFLYWTDGSNNYYPGDKVKVTADLELTAVYGDTAQKTSITYHSNYPADSGLTDETSTVNGQDNNTAITLEKAGFGSPTGYYFAHWEDASGNQYAVGKTIGIDNTSANDLNAVWEKKKEITLKANSGTYTYDGSTHSASGVETDIFTINGVSYTVSGYTTSSPERKDAGNYSNIISGTYVVKDGNGADVTYQFTVKTENGSLTISKRTVNLKSESDSKAYDGTVLTKPEVTVTGDGFATGEVSDITATGSITKAGSVTNTITYTAEAGFKAGNYEITKSEGTLTITQNADQITVTAGSDTKVYDGTALTKNTYSIAGLPEGFTAEVMVSGTVTDAGSAENEVTSVIIRKGNEDVTSQFSGIETASGTLTVTKRTVTLKSESASKPFDGNALTAPKVTITGDGFVDGEVSEVKATGSITRVGSTANKIEYTQNSGFKADNYMITKDEGTLTITQNENAIVVNAKNAEKKYDGSPLIKNEADVTGLPEGYTAEVTVSGTITDA